MDAPPLNADELDELYNWVDQVPLSKPKKNIARDFSDGSLAAEVIHFFLPRLVELHNYPSANSLKQKQYNWNTLNNKVFKKIGFQLSKNDIEQVINCIPDSIERILKVIQVKLDNFLIKQQNKKGQQNDDQSHIQKMEQNQKLQNYNQQNNLYDSQMIMEKDQTIQELRETIEILELKINKLETLVNLKDTKIRNLEAKFKGL